MFGNDFAMQSYGAGAQSYAAGFGGPQLYGGNQYGGGYGFGMHSGFGMQPINAPVVPMPPGQTSQRSSIALPNESFSFERLRTDDSLIPKAADAQPKQVPTVKKDHKIEQAASHEQEEETDEPETEIEDIEAALAELQDLQMKTVTVATKWEQAKKQLVAEIEKETELKALVAEAEEEAERLRARVPKRFDDRPSECYTEPPAALHNFNPSSALSCTKKGPKKGAMGLEVATEGEFVHVSNVLPGGACEQAGILQGDIIQTWNGKHVASHADFVRAISVCGAGIPVPVEVLRPGIKTPLTVEVVPKRKA
jgi:C-terminal processing protease CtpA/Prc